MRVFGGVSPLTMRVFGGVSPLIMRDFALALIVRLVPGDYGVCGIRRRAVPGDNASALILRSPPGRRVATDNAGLYVGAYPSFAAR